MILSQIAFALGVPGARGDVRADYVRAVCADRAGLYLAQLALDSAPLAGDGLLLLPEGRQLTCVLGAGPGPCPGRRVCRGCLRGGHLALLARHLGLLGGQAAPQVVRVLRICATRCW
jgi:hypothetical protein